MNQAQIIPFRLESRKQDMEQILAGITSGKKILSYQKNQRIFSQGDSAEAIFGIQQGRVKMTVVSFTGKEATLGVVGPQEFIGVECLGRQSQRLYTATPLEPVRLVRVERSAMTQALREHPGLLDFFLSDLSNRTVSLQKDLCTQIFDPSEKRLMRVLLKLAECDGRNQERVKVPRLSHDVLATMVGTTRSRVTFFINKFRKLGVIDYEDGILVNRVRLTSALQED